MAADPFAGASERLFDAFVGSEPNATYYPKGGSAVTCRLYFTGRNREDTKYGDVDASAIEAQLLESEVGSDVRQGDRIEYNGGTYRVAVPPRGDGYVWDLILTAGVATA